MHVYIHCREAATYLGHNAAQILLHHSRHEVRVCHHLLLCGLLLRLLVQNASALQKVEGQERLGGFWQLEL